MHTPHTPSNRLFVPGLDGLRFISFFLIFVHHAEDTHIPFIDFIKDNGWIGVDIFFTVSAFLLTRLLTAEFNDTGTIHLRKYFMRRILRIWPLFFTYLTVIILFYTYTNNVAYETGFRFVSLFTFTDNFLTAMYGFNPIPFTGHLWTIAYEEQFYLLLPFVILLTNRMSAQKKMVLFVCIVITGFTIRFLFIFYHLNHPAIWVLPMTHFESILTGIGLGMLDSYSMEKKKVSIQLITALAGFLILFLPGTGVISYHLMILYPCIGIFTGGVVALIITARNVYVKKIITSTVLSYLGKISFGLYVFHILCTTILSYVLRKISIYDPLLSTICALLLTIVISVLSYQILEIPFLKLKKKFTIIPSR